MTDRDQINKIIDIEALAILQRDSAQRIINECHKARQKLEGVSTPSTSRKGDRAKTIRQLVAVRNARIHKVNLQNETQHSRP